jgi:tRNA nucleotidyltransferase (CCA-adding enzyme)
VAEDEPERQGERLLAMLAGQPGGSELLALEDSGAGLALVGGAVRDLLLDRTPRELDVVLDAEAPRHAELLAERLGGESNAHERFGTATVVWADGRIDIATRRAESYPAPGALPEIRPGSAAEDLLRRDFTVNALALALHGSSRGELETVPGALEDLAEGRLRVLHERSFVDDPTRLLRLARYASRLHFQIEPGTQELATAALSAGALETVSGARLGAELRLALTEPDPLRCLRTLDQLGLLTALGLAVPFARELAECALSLLPEDGSAAELLMATLGPTAALLDRLEFSSGARERILNAASSAPELAERLAGADRASELYDALQSASPEAAALAGAIAAQQGRTAGREAAAAWLTRLRHVRLTITGEDLIAAGMPAGPELGRALTRALARKLDGELEDGPQAELAAALEGTR